MTYSQSSSMNATESLPIDLIANILSYLPAKSVGKFRSVSKLWNSTVGQSYFTDLFLTRSSARPHLLFSIFLSRNWCCLSSPQPQNLDENSSIALDFRIPLGLGAAPVSGLIFCRRSDSLKKVLKSRIGNPTTGQYVDLPILRKLNNPSEFLGYDPIGKQYKILCMSKGQDGLVARYHLLTYPFEKNESWRSIQCPTRHKPLSYEKCYGICINGILYYVGIKEGASSYVLVCFDVRSEEFKFINEPEAQALGSKRGRRSICLTNFNGKLVSIRCHDLGDDVSYSGHPRKSTKLELCVWFLEDDKKPEWSKKHVYRFKLPCDFFGRVVGMIGTGEIVLAPYNIHTSNPFYVYYSNPVRNTLKKVKIQGIKAFVEHTVPIYLDHVENISFMHRASVTLKQ